MGLFKLGLSFVAWAIPILWEICLSIDALIYEVAQLALQAFFDIAELSTNVELYSQEVRFIMNRIMVLAGVFALFRLAIMLINYLVDPNKTSEVSKNGPQIVKNIVLALVLLMTSNLIFSTLADFQSMVIKQDVIPKIVYGPEEYKDSEYSIKDSAQRFVNRVFLIFFQENGINCEGNSASYCMAYNNVKSGEDGIVTLVPYSSSNYFSYKPFISGIFGMVLVYYFVIFAIELGTRIVKLVVLQVISPIPVIMSIDPSQKNKLSNFVKVYGSIYLQLFIRIITVYLAFVVAGLVVETDFGIGTINSGMLLTGNVFVDILLYIGIFHAAKELPKLFEDALGLKMSSSLGGKSFGGVLKGIVGGGVGLLGGAVAGGIAGGIGGAVVGAGSGMVSGGLGVAASKDAAAGIKEAVNSFKGSYAKGRRVSDVGGILHYGGGLVDNFTGRNARIDRQATVAADRLSAYDNFESSVLSDYAASINPMTGQKFGTMDEDFSVISARGARDQFIEDYNKGTAIDPATGVAYTPAAASSHLNTLRSSVKFAEDSYKQKAFSLFESKSIDSGTGKVKYDPKKYSTLSASEKAHHDITRIDKKALTAAPGSTLYSTFDTERKTAKKMAKETESEKQTDRYRGAQKASGK